MVLSYCKHNVVGGCDICIEETHDETQLRYRKEWIVASHGVSYRDEAEAARQYIYSLTKAFG